ncbi:MAG: hypothetical protein ACREAM_30590, partial [Blastocatellia bacterium]
MKLSIRLVLFACLLVCGAVAAQAQTRGGKKAVMSLREQAKVYVLIWFDVEDYFAPETDDA